MMTDWSLEDETLTHQVCEDERGYIQGRGYTEDDPDNAAPRLNEQVDAFQDALELIASFRHKRRIRGAEEIEACWLRHFAAFSLAEKGCMQLARGDLVFAALCLARAARRPQLGVSWQWLALSFMQLVVISCQHTAESRAEWPDEEEWEALLDMLGAVVDRFVEGGSKKRETLLAQVRSNLLSFTEPPARLAERYGERQEPRQLLEHLAAMKRKAAAQRAQGSADVREEVSEEARGALWRISAEELLSNYLRVGARVYRAVTQHNRMAARWGGDSPLEPYNLSRPALEHARRWLQQRCRVDQPDEVRASFRELANQWFAPLGAETERFRDMATRDEKQDPLTVLNNEVGIDIGQMLHDQTLMKLEALAGDPDCLHWDALFFTLVSSLFRQRAQLEWRERYTFTTEEEVHGGLAARADAAHYQGVRAQRPLLVKLQRRFWLLEAGRLRACEGLLHAVLSWAYRVRTGFGDELECTTNVRAVCDELLVQDPIV